MQALATASSPQGGASAQALADEVKSTAARLGLDLVGIADALPFARAEAALQAAAAAGYRFPFTEPEVGRRVDPAQVLPGVRSIIAAGLAYGPDGRTARAALTGRSQPGRGWLSRYCRGRDYHHVLGQKLTALAAWLEQRVPGARTRVCVDTSPPLDRAVAERAGLGFFGQSTNLITRRFGTWVFLGEILTDMALHPDSPGAGTCGGCTRCIDACPTGALVGPYVLNSDACLSYITQEKGFVPERYRRSLGNFLFGCDICQDVCPYNLRVGVEPGRDPELLATPVPGGEAGPPLSDVLSMTRSQFQRWFRPTAAGWRGKTVLQRNALIALGNSGDPAALEPVLAALKDKRPVLRGHAAWALSVLARSAPGHTDRARQILHEAAAAESDATVQGEIARALSRLAAADE